VIPGGFASRICHALHVRRTSRCAVDHRTTRGGGIQTGREGIRRRLRGGKRMDREAPRGRTKKISLCCARDDTGKGGHNARDEMGKDGDD
jgi:hypothetical protein